MPAFYVQALALRILAGVARLSREVARARWIDGAGSMRSASDPLWTSFQTEMTN
jgi:hypothetical protein